MSYSTSFERIFGAAFLIACVQATCTSGSCDQLHVAVDACSYSSQPCSSNMSGSMKLYLSPGACSQASHVALRATGARFDIEKVDLGSHKTASGEDYYTINPSGGVPALRLENGEILTESIAVLLYIADQAPQYGLAPPEGTLARYRLIEKLSFISSEIHKGFGPLFAKPPPDVAAATIKRVLTKVAILDKVLSTNNFLLGDHFTVADGLLFVILGWNKMLSFDYSHLTNIVAWRERVAALPHVAEAMRVEFG